MFRKLILTAALGLAAASVAPTAWSPEATAAEPRAGEGRLVPVPANVRQVKLALAKSIVIDYDEDIRDVLVSNPQVADAIVRTNRRLYLMGNKFGTTNIFVFGASGRQVASFEVQVQPDTANLEALLHRLLPGAHIRAEAVAGTVVLSGEVRTPAEAAQAQDVALKFVGGGGSDASGGGGGGGGQGGGSATGSATSGGVQVVNALSIRGKDQVLLKVTIVEMQRSALKNLGVNLASGAGGSLGGLAFNSFHAGNAIQLNGSSTTGTLSFGGGNKITSTLVALEQNGVTRTLAEPNLTAISGEEASFLVGGEYPVPVGQDNGVTTIEFKKFGVALGFVPVVLSEGRISLKVNTEVSEINNEVSINANGLVIPGLRVRRADATIELPSGGVMVMAGLLSDNARSSIQGTPAIMDLPILGTLFKSREFQRSQTEMAIFVQPLIVGPVGANKLVRPDQNYQVGTDAAAVFLGRVNKVYRVGGSPQGNYHGKYGFIYE